MTNIAKHHSGNLVKTLLLGDSGQGKTGSLCSLAAAGYKVRVIDLDNGLDVVKAFLTDPNSVYVRQNPNVAENVEYETITDKMVNRNGTLIPEKPTVWTRTMTLLQRWKTDTADLGDPHTWGPDCVLWIDSLSALSRAALYWHLQMNGALGMNRTQNEGRRDIGAAQDRLRSFLEAIKDVNLNVNMVLTAHVTFTNEIGERPGEGDTGMGYPSAVGRALSPQIPQAFNNTLIAAPDGAGKRRIFTSNKPQGGQVIVGKTSAPTRVKPSYGIETGLAEYFFDVTGRKPGGAAS